MHPISFLPLVCTGVLSLPAIGLDPNGLVTRSAAAQSSSESKWERDHAFLKRATCPTWDFSDTSGLSSSSLSKKANIAGRLASSEQGKPLKLQRCVIANAWPLSEPLKIPNYIGGSDFFDAEKRGEIAKDPAKEAVPRWYSTTIGPAPACTPGITKVPIANYPYVRGSSKPSEIPSMDHAWEKSWLTEFFSSIVVQKATSFADTKETVPDDISCDDFLLYMFNSKNGARGTKNLLKSVYDNGIASTAHLDFVGMTQVINNEWKGFVWDVDFEAATQNVIKSTNPTANLAKMPANRKFAIVQKALAQVDEDLTTLVRIRNGIFMTNQADSVEKAHLTNTRVYKEMQALDTALMKAYPSVAPFKHTYFATKFRAFMDQYVKDRSDVALKQSKALFSKITTVMDELEKLHASGDIVKAKQEPAYSEVEAKWDGLKKFSAADYTISIGWSWS